MRRHLFSVALFSVVPALLGQESPRSTSGPASSAAANAAETRSDSMPANPESRARSTVINSLESGTLLEIIKKALETDPPSVDPETGKMSWKGHSYDVGQFRVFRGRFERYLSLQPNRDQDTYAATLDEIFKLLSTRNADGTQDAVITAWKLLYQASEYEPDGGNSLGVANQVFNAWRIRDERQALNVTQSELQRLRSKQQGEVVYVGDTLTRQGAAGLAEAARDTAANAAPSATVNTNLGEGAGSGGNQRGTPRAGGANGRESAPSQTAGPVGQVFRMRELAETEAKIKALEASGLLSVTQAKLQFQSQIVSLFLQRRFQHALIASSFYRYIFKGSHQNLEVGKKEISAFLPQSDLALTIETIEFLSREAINDVNDGMAAVRASFEDGRKMAAIERLQETFFLGEYLPALTQFESPKRQALYTLYRKVDQARKLAELKDYDAVAPLVEEIGTLTSDFRGQEVLAAVRSAQRLSTLALNAAQQSAAKADYLRAQEFVERAAQIWPLNPAIRSYTENMSTQADLGTQAAAVFDDAYKREDYRRIYDQRGELAVAFLNDTVRRPQLASVIDKMSRVEIYLAQTEELLAQNNAYSAWEALVAASGLVPNDVVLNQRMAQLAPRVADFVAFLDRAKRSEQAGALAASLAQYLAAQDLHPPSQLARTGLARVGEAVFDQLAGRGVEKSNTGDAASAPAR